MSYNPAVHHRRSIRLPGYDYTQAGAYFVTLVTHRREALFGEVVAGEMRLSALGRVAAAGWLRLARFFPRCEVSEWVVMPNHVHAIVILNEPEEGGLGKGEASAALCKGEASALGNYEVPQSQLADASPQRGGETIAVPRSQRADASPQRGLSLEGETDGPGGSGGLGGLGGLEGLGKGEASASGAIGVPQSQLADASPQQGLSLADASPQRGGETIAVPRSQLADALPKRGLSPEGQPDRETGGAGSLGGPGKGEASALGAVWVPRSQLADASPQQGLSLADASSQRGGETIAVPHSQLADASPQREPQRPNGTQPGSLNAIIQNYKSTVARQINAQRGTPGAPVWQRNYYEHIIRSEKSYITIATYILNNPAQWELDQLRLGDTE